MEAMVPEPVKKAPRPDERPNIPGYRVDGVIGRGATGTVFRACQLAVDREVALKVLHPELASKPRVVQRLQREARTTARLANPHIVSAIDMGETDGRWWYAMELVDGPSLALVLRQEGHLGEREALRLFIPLCEALEHLWEHGVVHRDIKPANILIDRTVGARLADLGLAFAEEDPSVTNQGGTLGTPHYISPEQAVDSTQADVRSDIWSFGATLYHALTGRPPFQGDSTAEILSSVLYARVPDPLRFSPTLSKGLVLVLRKCLTREPLDRYQTPRELLLDLERVRERRAPKVSTRALDPVEREPRPWVRPLLVTGAVAACLGLVLLATGRLGGAGEAGPGPGAQTPEPFEDLELVASRIEDRPEDAAQHLRDLDALAARVPPAHRERWRDLRNLNWDLVHRRLLQLFSAAEQDLNGAMEVGDFVGAWRQLGTEVPRDLTAATGYPVDELGELFVLVGKRRAELERRLADRQAQLMAAVKGGLDAARRKLVDDAVRLRDKYYFQSALQKLDVDREALLNAAGFPGYRFPPAEEEELFAPIQGALESERVDVKAAWRKLDGELVQWITAEADKLAASLTPAELANGTAVDQLARAFKDELFRIELQRDQMPDEVSAIAKRHLAAKSKELEDREEELRATRQNESFELTRVLGQDLWQRRDYTAVALLWEEFLGVLQAEPGDPDRAWRRELLGRAGQFVHEAELLGGLLRRAAAGVLAADGSTRLLAIGSGIYDEGRISAGVDPLTDGFEFEPRGGGRAQRLHLHRPEAGESLRAASLLELAGLDLMAGDELTPEDRLVMGVFFFHEGELEKADFILRGPLPTAGASGALATGLSTRVRDALANADAEQQAEEEEVEKWVTTFTQLKDEKPELALHAANELLTNHRDHPGVIAIRDELEAGRAELLNRRRSFESAYAPDRIQTEDRGGITRMEFDFNSSSVGSWQAGSWDYDGVGWSLPPADVARTDEDLLANWGARLGLREPLDFEDELELVLHFEVLDREAPPTLLVVSVLNFHVALAGTGLRVDRGQASSRLLVGEGDLATVLKRLHRGEGVPRPRLLAKEGPQVLRIRVKPRPGSVRVELDGVALGDFNTPKGKADDPSIVLRSWDPIRLSTVELAGQRAD